MVQKMHINFPYPRLIRLILGKQESLVILSSRNSININPWSLGGSFMVPKIAITSLSQPFKGLVVVFGDSFGRTV